MTPLEKISIWEMTGPLKWTSFRRLGLIFNNFESFFRYDKLKVRKIINRDLKIAEAENKEADQFIKEFAIEAENQVIANIPF